MLSVGLHVLSFLRRLGWLVLAALLVGYYALESQVSLGPELQPPPASRPRVPGKLPWKWPTQLLRVQIPVFAGCLLTAGLLYGGRFEDWLRWVSP